MLGTLWIGKGLVWGNHRRPVNVDMSVMEIGPVSGYIRWESEASLQMQLRSLLRWL